MSDTLTLDRPEAKSTFGQAAGHGDDGSGVTALSPFTDFQRKRYVDLMAEMRGRVLTMVGNVRNADENQKKHSRQISYDFLKAGLGSTLNLYSAIRNPMKMVSWLVNIVETGMQIGNSVRNNNMAKLAFERDKDGLLFTLRTAAHVDSQVKPTDKDGKPLFVESPLMAPNPFIGTDKDKAFVAKFIPEFLPHDKFKRQEDRVDPADDKSPFKEVNLHKMLYPQHPANKM
jgi:hypothetical protein